MRRSLTCLAAIGLSAGLFAESQEANGYNWEYEHIPDGVRHLRESGRRHVPDNAHGARDAWR